MSEIIHPSEIIRELGLRDAYHTALDAIFFRAGWPKGPDGKRVMTEANLAGFDSKWRLVMLRSEHGALPWKLWIAPRRSLPSERPRFPYVEVKRVEGRGVVEIVENPELEVHVTVS